jgi:proteic killer suppression protein
MAGGCREAAGRAVGAVNRSRRIRETAPQLFHPYTRRQLQSKPGHRLPSDLFTGSGVERRGEVPPCGERGHCYIYAFRKTGYTHGVIESFRCLDTERLFRRERVARFVNIESAARRRLDALHVAAALRDLLARPSNRLEALKRDRRGQHSIRINDRYRICFRWREGSAYDVEIVDYH